MANVKPSCGLPWGGRRDCLEIMTPFRQELHLFSLAIALYPPTWSSQVMPEKLQSYNALVLQPMPLILSHKPPGIYSCRCASHCCDLRYHRIYRAEKEV